MPELEFTSWAGLAAVGAAMGLFWSNLKNVFAQLSGLLIYQSGITTALMEIVTTHIRTSYRCGPTGLLWFGTRLMKLNGRTLYRFVPWVLPNGASIWYGKRGVFLVSARDGFTLYSLRFFSDPVGLVRDSIEAYNSVRDAQGAVASRFSVYRILGTAGDGFTGGNTVRPRDPSTTDSPSLNSDSSNDWRSPLPGVDRSFMYDDHEFMPDTSATNPMAGLFFPRRVHELLRSLDNWYMQRDWYTQRSLPWRTGVLLHGPGGTGKSSLARVVAERMGLPLYQFYLNTLTDKEFVNEWDSMNAPCVVALEDFDTVFHGREPVTIHKSLSFECVLNQISGVNSMSGVLLIVTTNNLHHVDAAMGQMDEQGRPTRPGRIDHICYLGVAEDEQRRDIATHVLGGWADDLIPLALSQTVNGTAAQCTSICSQLALERLSSK